MSIGSDNDAGKANTANGHEREFVSSRRGDGAAVPGSKGLSQPTDAQVQEGLAKSQRVLLALGETAAVLMKSRQYRSVSLADFQAMVLPAITSGQFLVARAYSASIGLTVPVAVALWASVSEQVDRRLAEKVDGPTELSPEEWTSGDIPWLVTYVGAPGAINQMLESLQQKTLKGRSLKVRTKGKDGAMVVRTFSPARSKQKETA